MRSKSIFNEFCLPKQSFANHLARREIHLEYVKIRPKCWSPLASFESKRNRGYLVRFIATSPSNKMAEKTFPMTSKMQVSVCFSSIHTPFMLHWEASAKRYGIIFKRKQFKGSQEINLRPQWRKMELARLLMAEENQLTMTDFLCLESTRMSFVREYMQNHSWNQIQELLNFVARLLFSWKR